MMLITILDSYSLEGSDLSPITDIGDCDIYVETTDKEVVNRCYKADVIVSNKVKILKDHIEQLPNLKLICVAATGMNNIDLDAARERGVVVKNVPAYSTDSVAEATMGLVLALKRNLVFFDEYVKSGKYAESGRCFNLSRPITQIKGAKWGVIGLGAIGDRVAQIAQFMGAQVSFFSVSGMANSEIFHKHESLEEILRESDIVSIHTPLTDKTRNLIGKRELEWMKKTAILINVARGGIVNEDDLAYAIANGTIAGAGVDVFEFEPIKSGNLLVDIKKIGGDPNRIVMAPHCAWSSREACKVLVEQIAQNIRIFYNL